MNNKQRQLFFENSISQFSHPIWAIAANSYFLRIIDPRKSSFLFAENDLGNITQFRRAGVYPLILLVALYASQNGKIDFTNSKLKIIFVKNRLKKQFLLQKAPLVLNRLTGVACLHRIYSANILFNTAQIFDKNGHYLFHYAEQGYGKGPSGLPVGLYIDTEDRICTVDDYNTQIQFSRYFPGEKDE